MESTILLEMMKVSKSFTGTKAVDSVSFDCMDGEVHCLVGENGAGKSTLMKMLAGIHQPDSGIIRIHGRDCILRTNAESKKQGIGVVYQELSLLKDCTVGENISMGAWPKKGLFVDWDALNKNAEQALLKIGLDIEPGELIAGLPMAIRQMIEIGKVLSQDPKIIIFDEPTASLSKAEVKRLFLIINQLKEEGKGIIYISHRLEEVFALADRVTVMKDGRKMITDTIDNFDEERLISKMVGRELKDIFPKKSQHYGEEIFSAQVRYRGHDMDLSFSVFAGEVLGIGGLQGQGQIKLLQAVFGLEAVDELKITMDGVEQHIESQVDAVAAGIALIPENRGDEGIFLDASVYQNLASATLNRRSKFGFVDEKSEKSEVIGIVEDLAIKIASPAQAAKSLSGGNMQKLVIGKWLIGSPKVVILLEPTKGVDVGTKQQIYRIIRDLAERNVAVIMYSSDMLELIGVSDRVLVMNQYQFTADLRGEEITEENIMKAAVGKNNSNGETA